MHLPKHYCALFPQALWPHDDGFHHLIDQQFIVRAEIPDIECRSSHSWVIRLTFNIYQLEPIGIETDVVKVF
jgi:hypothetical protein